MPHRCLACSLTLPDGAALAGGCPRCRGRAFHFEEASSGARSREEENPELWSWESRQAWVRGATRAPTPSVPPDLPAAAPAAPRAAPLAGLQVPTVRIDAAGAIDVDVGALLNENPVITERNGTYEVDLPGALRPRRSR